MRITTILNQKGGTGKSTTAHAIAAGLNLRHLEALIIDADPQGNITYTQGADPRKPGLYELLRGNINTLEAIQHTPQGDIIASSLDLAGADMEFTQTGREYLLREALESLEGRYTHVIIDSPPALGILSVNALTASTDVIIPACADIYSLQGLQQLLTTIGKVKRYSNPALKIAGLLITRKGRDTVATREMLEQMQRSADAAGIPLYRAMIREATAIRESQILQTSIFEHAPTAKVTADYNSFIDEYTAQEARKG